MKNKIEDLRNHLFAVLEALQDTENPMDLDRAKGVVDVAQTLINSAKVEVDFLRITGGTEGSGFIPEMPRQKSITHIPSYSKNDNIKKLSNK